ncbi:MAG: YbjQ family protein [Gemmatales bacterium]|nr:YbjQ family protein [Gemmatales bacterium]MCS7161297.1 YbjQ family protein [Gemmatales bacterium]MDW8176500.1 YbjQ family protein [Gemmatales bacterium]MDW8223703.1 YbjQ family protein [Gemmatales bacterium]
MPTNIKPDYLIVTTGNDVGAYEVKEYLGVVRDLVARSTGVARGFLGGLKSIIGGNVETWGTVCEEARKEAFARMIQHARELDANAVIVMRYDVTDFVQGAPKSCATAPLFVLVRFQPINNFRVRAMSSRTLVPINNLSRP